MHFVRNWCLCVRTANSLRTQRLSIIKSCTTIKIQISWMGMIFKTKITFLLAKKWENKVGTLWNAHFSLLIITIAFVVMFHDSWRLSRELKHRTLEFWTWNLKSSCPNFDLLTERPCQTPFFVQSKLSMRYEGRGANNLFYSRDRIIFLWESNNLLFSSKNLSSKEGIIIFCKFTWVSYTGAVH